MDDKGQSMATLDMNNNTCVITIIILGGNMSFLGEGNIPWSPPPPQDKILCGEIVYPDKGVVYLH